VVREQRPIEGIVRLSAEPVDAGLYKLSVQIENTTPETALAADRHNEVLLQAFISTHTILRVEHGEFVSLLEPPEALIAVAQECQNVRTWPVLIGDEGERDTLLSSPIILYDYPQIAPESPGTLFDGTEIDEILTLRILTLSDEEKAEIRQGDPRAREILERTEAMTPEQFMQLHGTIRSMRPIDEGAEA
jgi:hydrogenase maturation protease